MVTKVYLLNQLTNAKNNYIVGLAAISLLVTPNIYPLIENNVASFGSYKVSFKQIVTLLRNSNDREIVRQEFLKMLIRALLKESFEALKDYCEETKQGNLFKVEPWYQFARLIRNNLSHNFRFEFSKYDKSLLPVTWKSRTIDLTMEQQFLDVSFFEYDATWELFSEFLLFAETKLR